MATTWSPMHRYKQKTEDGAITCQSFPYGPHDGPHGLGETFVYSQGELLYSVDHYFSNLFFTADNGQYIVEFDFWLRYDMPDRLISPDGSIEITATSYDGVAIYIYRNGQLTKKIEVAQLVPNETDLIIYPSPHRFEWTYHRSDSAVNPLKDKMEQYPVFLEGLNLSLITADKKLVEIDIATGSIRHKGDAYQAMQQKTNWSPAWPKRKYKKNTLSG